MRRERNLSQMKEHNKATARYLSEIDISIYIYIFIYLFIYLYVFKYI